MKDQHRVLFFNRQVSVIANQLEDTLYYVSPSREYYSNRLTLMNRVCQSVKPPIPFSHSMNLPCCYTKSEMFFSHIVVLIILLLYLKRI